MPDRPDGPDRPDRGRVATRGAFYPGPVLWKKFPTHVFGAPFWGLPIGPEWTDLKILQLSLTQNKN